jgi:hypothetical protein
MAHFLRITILLDLTSGSGPATDRLHSGSSLNKHIHEASEHSVLKEFLNATLNFAFQFLRLLRLSSKPLELQCQH